MAKVFLSYAREDAAIAERLARNLEHGGKHDVWWDRDLVGGASFGPEIEQQLGECDVVIVIWTAASIRSPWVRDEAAIGRDAGKLLPLSANGIEAPIGFRQYHTIGISTGGRPTSAMIQKVEQAIEHITTREAAAEDNAGRVAEPSASPRSSWRISTAAAVLGLIAVASAIYVWQNRNSQTLTVAILPVSGGQVGATADYSRSMSTDMASFLSAHGNPASVFDPGDADARDASYRFNVSFAGKGASADTSVSMTAGDQRGIIWSRSWSVPDLSSVDLKKQMSFAASRALLCAMEAHQGSTRLNASLLKLYIVACSGDAQSDVSETEIESEYSQIVEQAPEFAPAWQNLAVVRSVIVSEREAQDGAAPQALRNAALDAIAHARQLTPRSAKIPLAEAALAANNHPEESLPLLNRAIELEPTAAIQYSIRSTALLAKGRLGDAVADSQRATELDPLSPMAAGLEIYVLMCAGKMSDAKDELAAAYKIWPHSDPIQQADFTLSIFYGDPRHAAQLLSKVGHENDAPSEPLLKTIGAREDPTPANVEAALGAWRKGAQTNPSLTTPYLLTLGMYGKIDEVFQVLNDPKSKRFVDTASLFRSEFKVLRRDKQFMAVAANYGLARYWKSTGNWPDFCSEPGLPYDCKVEAAQYAR